MTDALTLLSGWQERLPVWTKLAPAAVSMHSVLKTWSNLQSKSRWSC